jgi:hypothetical protein
VLHVQPEMVRSNNPCSGQNIQRTALWRRKYRSRNCVRRWNRCWNVRINHGKQLDRNRRSKLSGYYTNTYTLYQMFRCSHEQKLG